MICFQMSGATLAMPIPTVQPISSKEMTDQEMINYVNLKHFYEEAQSLMYFFDANPMKHIKG